MYKLLKFNKGSTE